VLMLLGDDGLECVVSCCAEAFRQAGRQAGGRAGYGQYPGACIEDHTGRVLFLLGCRLVFCSSQHTPHFRVTVCGLLNRNLHLSSVSEKLSFRAAFRTRLGLLKEYYSSSSTSLYSQRKQNQRDAMYAPPS
jgi:hypothetical protein